MRIIKPLILALFLIKMIDSVGNTEVKLAPLPQTEKIAQVDKKGSEYTFKHTLVMTEEKKDVWIRRIMNDRKAIVSLSIIDEIVSVTFDKNEKPETIEEALQYCASKFGYTQVKISLCESK